MARLRNRMTKAEFWTDPDLLCWPREKRWFYHGLRAVAEDSGCAEDSPFGWLLVLYPSPLDRDINETQLGAWRDELIADGKLIPYVGEDGRRYLYQRTFHEHEHPRNPQPPSLPLPPWVHWNGNDKDTRKGRYEVDTTLVPPLNGARTTLVQRLYNGCTTLPVQPSPVQSSPVLTTQTTSAVANASESEVCELVRLDEAVLADDELRQALERVLGDPGKFHNPRSRDAQLLRKLAADFCLMCSDAMATASCDERRSLCRSAFLAMLDRLAGAERPLALASHLLEHASDLADYAGEEALQRCRALDKAAEGDGVPAMLREVAAALTPDWGDETAIEDDGDE